MIEINDLSIVKNILSEDRVGNENIYGAVRNQKNIRILTDNKENPTGVLVQGDEFNYIYSSNKEFIIKVRDQYLESGYHAFGGVKDDIAKILKEKTKLKWEEKCHLYYIPTENFKIKQINSKPKEIKLEDIHIINEYYTYKSEHSLEELSYNLKCGPSGAIYEGDKMVSWLMTHTDGSMGVMYTLKEARKKGYAIDLTLHVAEKLIKNNCIPFIHIVQGNNPSIELAKKCGFKYHGEIEWFGIEK